MMGACHIEIYKEQITYDQYWNDRKEQIVDQGYAFFLDRIVKCLSKSVRPQFPLLSKIDFQSGEYDGESLILTPSDVQRLKREVDTICRIYNHQEFRPDLRSDNFRKCMNHHTLESEIEEEMTTTKDLLDKAISDKYWIRIGR